MDFCLAKILCRVIKKEHWTARELTAVLDYTRGNFCKVIKYAMTAWKNTAVMHLKTLRKEEKL